MASSSSSPIVPVVSSPIVPVVSNLPIFSDVTLPNYSFPFKLESDNYVVWKSQIFPAIIGCNMESFIDGTVLPPPTTIVETNTSVDGRTIEKLVPNPEYRLWRRLDQALLAWILSSISRDIHTQVSKVSITFTSQQLWSSLERLFGSNLKLNSCSYVCNFKQ